ncbi:MAG TPA: hypothetical protein VIL20_23530 [Sandaracinaceae bacterium]
MAGWETLLAALGGMILGVGVASIASRRRERRSLRQKLELEARVRREVVPVLERRAHVLRVPPAERGNERDGPIEVAVALASAIRRIEESIELPFGDTVEVARTELANEFAGKAREQA